MNFEHCEYGPYELRRLLRRHLLHGERVIGWGPVSRQRSATDTLLAVSISLLPVAGTILADSMGAGARRFLVLTDTRLLVLDTSSRGPHYSGSGIRSDSPISTVYVSNASQARTFRIYARGWSSPQTYSVQGRRSTAASRLVQGLELLASDSDRVSEILARTEDKPRAGGRGATPA